MATRSIRASRIPLGTTCDHRAVTTPRVLVFQHIAIEHPGVFRDFLAEDGIAWTAVELDEGEAIPDLEDFDVLWVMGGPMDVWQDDLHPWLEPERRAIREAVAVGPQDAVPGILPGSSAGMARKSLPRRSAAKSGRHKCRKSASSRWSLNRPASRVPSSGAFRRFIAPCSGMARKSSVSRPQPGCWRNPAPVRRRRSDMAIMPSVSSTTSR